ncbi:MAG: ATP synthase subunit I [Rhodoferax sp.]|uniref:ATP synthase subunit I n=1 Tax=Rhodoferax sp. TaxID=50421 RepID=UPI002ACD2181|nr:ATP synthase subunit I [Rhodoferax sp.]MDZ7890367.1 ATP synthase subunit I [Rhodoferax sp.]
MTTSHDNSVIASSGNPDGVLEDEFKPLTAAEAHQWRQRNPPVSPWRVIGMQCVAAVVAVVIAWLGFGQVVGLSVLYGSLAVMIPAAVLARGLRKQVMLKDSGAAFLGFVVWEVVKVVLTVAMLLAAPKLVPELNWLALVAGFVVAMKVYWVAAWLQSKRKHSTEII